MCPSKNQPRNPSASPQNPVGDNYYYFNRLTDNQKAIYKKLLFGINAHDKVIKTRKVPVNEMSMIFEAVRSDNPLLFYVSSFVMKYNPFWIRCSVIPKYIYTKQFSAECTTMIKEYLRVFDAVKGRSDIDKEVYVHDYCLDNFTYDHKNGDYAHSILGTVFCKSSVCEGVARFVKLAFDYLGVKSLVVFGKAKGFASGGDMEPHGWNIVNIDNKTYHLDVTFDMGCKGVNRYKYFNLSDDDIKMDHIITGDVPMCTTSRKYCL
jgi:transglutaminase/protease-like cytokinesis protein 3